MQTIPEMQNRRILIIEDDKGAWDTYESFLVRCNYHLIFAENGQEGMEKAAENPPDLFLLDVMLPGKDGFEICREIKSDSRFRHIPIILVTALQDKESMVNGLESGADEFLTKPISGIEFRARIRSMLRIKILYDELLSMMKLREDLAHMLVHDIRNALFLIQGYAEILKRDFQEKGQINFLDRILSQSGHLGNVLGDLLFQIKSEENGIRLNLTDLLIRELIRDSAEQHRLLAQGKEISIVIGVPDTERRIQADANLFRRVLDNLLSNAIKFSPARTTIRVQMEYPDPDTGYAVRIRISDQGQGVAPEYREKIFRKYEVARMKQEGIPQFGLGLAFCRMVVEAHGGRIQVEPGNPAGSVFIIELPVRQEEGTDE